MVSLIHKVFQLVRASKLHDLLFRIALAFRQLRVNLQCSGVLELVSKRAKPHPEKDFEFLQLFGRIDDAFGDIAVRGFQPVTLDVDRLSALAIFLWDFRLPRGANVSLVILRAALTPPTALELVLHQEVPLGVEAVLAVPFVRP